MKTDGLDRRSSRFWNQSLTITFDSRVKWALLAWAQTRPILTLQTRQLNNAGPRSQKLSFRNVKKNLYVTLRASLAKVDGPTGITLFLSIYHDPLIYGPGPRIIAFVLNAQINSVRTPDMLHLWGYIPSARCVICDAEKCTLHHVLVNCKFALEQGRYTWRHDSVLINIEKALSDLIPGFNRRKPSTFAEITRKSFQSCFVREGQKKPAETYWALPTRLRQ